MQRHEPLNKQPAASQPDKADNHPEKTERRTNIEFEWIWNFILAMFSARVSACLWLVLPWFMSWYVMT